MNFDQTYFITRARTNGTTFRKCLRCNLVVDKNGEPDQDHYSARQYFKIVAIPVEERCKHERSEPGKYYGGSDPGRDPVPGPVWSNRELLVDIGNVTMAADLRLLLCKIIRRLP